MLEVAHRRPVAWVGFSPDEGHLVSLSPEDGSVTALDGGQRVTSVAVPHAKLGTVHPSGTLVVANELGKLVFLDLLSGQPRKTLSVGGKQRFGPVHDRAPGDTALRKVDPAELEAKINAALQQQLAQAEAMQEKVRAAYRKAGRPEPPDLAERMKRELQQLTEGVRPQLERLLAAARPDGTVPVAALHPALDQGAERVMSLEISADGRWLFYACQQGVRALARDALLAAAEVTPAPEFAAAAEPVRVDLGGGHTAQQHT